MLNNFLRNLNSETQRNVHEEKRQLQIQTVSILCVFRLCRVAYEQRGLNTKMPTVVFFLGPTTPLP